MSKSLIVDIPLYPAVEEVVPDEERCKYISLGEIGRCKKQRCMPDEIYCVFHKAWDTNVLAVYGAPYPDDDQSIHMFLATMLGMVLSGKVKASQYRIIEKLCRMLVDNSRQRNW